MSTANSVSPDSIDYLERSGTAPPAVPRRGSRTTAAPASRRLLRIEGIGRLTKTVQPVADYDQSQPWRLPTEDLLTGLFAYKIALAFVVRGEPGGLHVEMGVWSRHADTSSSEQERRLQIVGSLLRSLYPAVAMS